MNTAISKTLRAIVMRNGIILWHEKEKMEKLQAMLEKSEKHSFIKLEGDFINTADITGIFTPQAMDEMVRRKNFEWKCAANKWHKQRERCDHSSEATRDATKEKRKLIRECKKCNDMGMVVTFGSGALAKFCKCWKDYWTNIDQEDEN